MSFFTFNFITSNKKLLYIIINIFLTLFFGLTYWLIDILSIHNRKLLGIKKSNLSNNSLIYYIWYSLITQTTVGYGGLVNYKDVNVDFNNELNIIKIVNIIQLLTIFLVPLILI